MNKLNISALAGILLLMFALGIALTPHKSHAQEVTGLSDWNVFLDPGHSQTENMGLYGYSEAEKVLRVAWALRDFFQDQTDIDTVYMARLTDQDFISLEGRVALANTLGADFYYSIHSDAGPPAVNSTLMLYGGWKSNGVLVEKTPQGGGAYGAILDFDLTGAMRIPRRGNFADRVFYLGDVFHHENQWPYLYVNRVSTMASLLSEAGFHTNPGQQMLNLNAEWKVLEALSAYRSFLEWHDIDRPAIGIATGIVKDVETGLALNDVTVTIGDQTYVTDGFESLFNQYSVNPDQLRNGFYFIQGLEPLSTIEVQFAKEGYQTLVTDLEIVSNPNGRTHENLSFLDPMMVSLVPPVVSEVQPADALNNLIPGTNLVIRFSRKMNKTSVEDAFSIEPTAEYTLSWSNDFTMVVNTSQFDFLQTYTITLDGDVAQNSLTEQFLDGNNNGQEGGDFVLTITMSDLDVDAPQLIAWSPSEDTPARMLRPIIRLVYDEEIMPESIAADAIMVTSLFEGEVVQGEIHHLHVNGQSVMHFFPTENLVPGTAYKVTIAAGLADMFDNATLEQTFRFSVLNQPITQSTVIDNFNSGIVQWWNPQQAGQTLGIITELTSRTANADVVVRSVGSTGSMKLSYGWDMDYVGTPYIRQYLPPGAPQNNNRFNIDNILQVYIYGDGSGNQVRLAIRDGLNQLEANQWITIDWMGWKLVSWDLANEPVFGLFGVGNGQLDGANFFFDSFHLRYAEGGNEAGAIYFDHLHFVKREAVQYPTTLFETWQSYEDFTSELFPWHTVDVKGDVTWNPQGFTFPGSGTPYAFKVMNPAETTPPVANDHPAVDGDKYLIAMQSQTPNDNKWLISPQLMATDQTELRFFARSIQVSPYGPEQFRVWISLDNAETFTFDPDNFVLLSGEEPLEAPLAWTPYTFFLGNHAGQVYRFAIQYVSTDDYMLMIDKIEVDQAQTFNLSLIAEPQEGGQVSGEGSYAAGQQIPLSATPATGWAFVNWTDNQGNELSTQAGYTFTMPAEHTTLTGHFALRNYTLTLNVVPDNGGTVQGAGSYTFGQEVNAIAQPAEGFRFLRWTNRDGHEVSTLAHYTFTMPASNLELNALFEDQTHVEGTNPQTWQIFPNPTRDKIYVSSAEIITFVRVIDLGGRILTSQKADASTLQLSLQGIGPGIYLLQIETAQEVVNHRIQIIP